nr:DMT family transporter [Kocuria subflava]
MSSPRGVDVLAQVVAVLCGTGMAVQSRLNGELGARTGDAAAASLVSFGTGLVIVVLLAVLLPAGRRGTRNLITAVRDREIPWWFLISGMFGAYLVLIQTFTTPLVGVAVFILGVVVGQAIGGLAVDRVGLSPGGVKTLTGWRFAGTALVVLAVLLAQAPRFLHEVAPDGSAQAPSTTSHQADLAGVGTFVLMAVLQVTVGVGVAVQTAMNGRMAQQARTPITSTLVNFTGGAILLVVVTVVHRGTADLPPWHFPTQWWLYMGGVVGLVFVAAGAVLARVIGVLRTSLSMTAGMLTGALLLDVLVPTAGALITPLTVVGTALTFVGLLIVTLPWRLRRRI